MLFPPLSRFLLGRQRSNHCLAVLVPHGHSPSAALSVLWGTAENSDFMWGWWVWGDPGLLCRTFPKPIYPPMPSGRMAQRKQLGNAVSLEAVYLSLRKELTSLHMQRAPKCSLFLFLPVTASKCIKEHDTMLTFGLNIATQGQYS